MAEEERIRDHVKMGSRAEVSAELDGHCLKLEVLADQVWQKTHLEHAARVLPNILRCIARQIRILQTSAALPIEVAAAACRTIFELNVRTRVMIKDPTRIKDFAADRVFDEISLLEAFKRLSDSSTKHETLKPLNSRIEYLRQFATKWRLVKASGESTFKLAELAGEQEEYKALYGFYSKYTHASAWLVNTSDEERDGEAYRNFFLVQAQLYAFDAHNRIEDFVRQNTPPGCRPPIT